MQQSINIASSDLEFAVNFIDAHDEDRHTKSVIDRLEKVDAMTKEEIQERASK
jgi:hypothetical protein